MGVPFCLVLCLWSGFSYAGGKEFFCAVLFIRILRFLLTIKMHIMKKTILSILCLACVLSTYAYDFAAVNEEQIIYYNITSSSEPYSVEVTYKGTWYSDLYIGSIVIPESISYNGEIYFVTSIGKRAFSSCHDLTSVTIPNSVTEIGEEAFGACESLTSITIPNSVMEIGKSAFYGDINNNSQFGNLD